MDTLMRRFIKLNVRLIALLVLLGLLVIPLVAVALTASVPVFQPGTVDAVAWSPTVEPPPVKPPGGVIPPQPLGFAWGG